MCIIIIIIIIIVSFFLFLKHILILGSYYIYYTLCLSWRYYARLVLYCPYFCFFLPLLLMYYTDIHFNYLSCFNTIIIITTITMYLCTSLINFIIKFNICFTTKYHQYQCTLFLTPRQRLVKYYFSNFIVHTVSPPLLPLFHMYNKVFFSRDKFMYVLCVYPIHHIIYIQYIHI